MQTSDALSTLVELQSHGQTLRQEVGEIRKILIDQQQELEKIKQIHLQWCDNLKGRLEQVTSDVETLLIGAGALGTGLAVLMGTFLFGHWYLKRH